MRIDHPGKENITGLKELWREAFGDTYEDIDRFFDTAFSPLRCMCIADGKDIAAALYWFECEYKCKKAAYIYAVATARDYRGRGMCHMLMDASHRLLREQGFAVAVLVPGESTLFDFYGKMGYKTFCSVSEYTFNADDLGVSLQKICKEEYSAVRRELLPEDSVIQERECIDYLSSYAELYKGDGFLCACVKSGDFLRITELLGEGKPEGIAYALSCNAGSVRREGAGRRFAMYLMLGNEIAEPPRYFGLAFD